MLVKRNKPSVTKICGMFIFPGVNIIPSERENEFSNNADFKHLLVTKIAGCPIHEIVSEGEAVEVESKSTGKKVESDLAGMNATNAIAVVKDTLSIPTLETFAETEERKSVLKAIDKQIETVRAEGVDKDGDEEE